MSNLLLKRKLLEESIRKHRSVMDDFTARLVELRESECMNNEDEFDGGQLAQKVQMDSEVLLLNNQLEFASEEMKLLERLNSDALDKLDHAALGAVVVTDKNTFFVSASIEQIEVNGQTYLGLSTHSPLFKAMRGKKKGDKFEFNGTTYTIYEIF